MTDHREDEPIRALFREQRARVERSGVPDFHAMMEQARKEAADAPELRVLGPVTPGHDATAPGVAAAGPDGNVGRPLPARRANARHRVLVLGGWASAALAAGLAALLLVNDPGGRRGDDEFERLVAAYASDASAGAWRSPTSGLLEVPGSELLRSVPVLGGSLDELGAGSGAVPPVPEGGQNRL